MRASEHPGNRGLPVRKPDLWERDYRRHLDCLRLARLKIAAGLVMVLIGLNAAAQYVFDPLLFDRLLTVRLVSIALCLVVWLFCYRKEARSMTFAIGLMLVGIVSADLEFAIMQSGGYHSPFQTGLAMLIVGAGLLVPFSPRQIMVICALVWTVFLAPAVLAGEHIGVHEPGFTVGVLFMTAATVITVASGYMTGRLRRREFFARRELAAERTRSEHLLLNILPSPIAGRLRRGETTISEHYRDVGILFADLVRFTDLAERMPADDLVAMLNTLFSDFDRLTERHGLEKIKTIGDAYMAAGGAPLPHAGYMQRLAALALDMRDAVCAFSAGSGRDLHIRIGLHCGPAVGGVIGLNKFTYDLWGDTVNIASRMESHGLPDAIQVSEPAYLALRDAFRFEKRGEIDIRGKGRLATWWLLGWL